MSDAYAPLRLLVAGEWIGADAREAIPVVDPATSETLAMLPMAMAADLDRAVDAAAAAFRGWRGTPVNQTGPKPSSTMKACSRSGYRWAQGARRRGA